MNLFAKRRIEAGLSQEMAASGLHVDRSTIAKWETGVAKPRLDKIPAIASLYKCPVAALISEETENENTDKAV